MKELTQKYLERENALKAYIESLVKNIKYLKQYIGAPEFTIKKLASSDSELSSIFKEIELAYQGEFTRSKAFELGKHKLLNCIKEQVESIKSNNITLEDYALSLLKDLEEQLEIVNRNIDMTVVNRRRTRYMTNSLTQRYIKQAIQAVIEAKAKEYNSALTLPQFVMVLREIMSRLKVCDLTELVEYIKKYNFKKHVLTTKIENPVEVQPLQSEIQLKEYEAEQLFRDYLKDAEAALELIATEDGELEIFNTLLDGVEPTYKLIKKNIDNFKEVIKSFATNEQLIVITTDKIYETLVVPYAESRITAVEYQTGLDNLLICLENLMVLATDIRHVILNNVSLLLAHVEIYHKIYTLIEETTIKGQLGKDTK